LPLDYGLDDLGIWFMWPSGQRVGLVQHVSTACGTHPVAVGSAVPGGEGAWAFLDVLKIWELNALGARRVFCVEVVSEGPQI